MHELSIASSVLDAVHAEARRHPDARVLKVGLRVGELAGVDPEALRFCFESLVKDTEFEPLTLAIEFIPRCHRCPQCGRVFPVANFDYACPGCAATQTECIGGTELELAYVEVETP